MAGRTKLGPKRRASQLRPLARKLGVNIVLVRRAVEPRAPELGVGPLHRRKPAINARHIGVFLGFGERCVNGRAVDLALEIVPETALLVHIGHVRRAAEWFKAPAAANRRRR